jgi:hypothetical protein
MNAQTVFFSFTLYVLFVLLPLIPALVIFKLFPDSKVAVSGPLAQLTVRATGAFAAYVVVVFLGYVPVQHLVTQINASRLYPFEGVVLDLKQDQVIQSDRFYTREVIDKGAPQATRDFYFVVLLPHPFAGTETILLNYWELNAPGGVGAPPDPTRVAMVLPVTDSFPQRFRLLKQGDHLTVESEADVLSASASASVARQK